MVVVVVIASVLQLVPFGLIGVMIDDGVSNGGTRLPIVFTEAMVAIDDAKS